MGVAVQYNDEHSPGTTKRRTTIRVKKNALHDELHIPRGQKIGRQRLEAAKAEGERTGNGKEVQRATFALNMNDNGDHGVVSSMSKDYEQDGHTSITVKHGRRRRKKKKGEGDVFLSDSRRTSHLVLPDRVARNFKIGDRVGAGLIHMSGPQTDEMEPDDDSDDDPAAGLRAAQRDIARY